MNAPLSILELRTFAQALTLEDFVRQMGPFVLVQSPPTEVVQRKARELGARPTFARGQDGRGAGFAELIAQFETLIVATLPTPGEGELHVGRAPDCELVIDDPSVSRRHAVLAWESDFARCVVRDTDSRNGTWVNGSSARSGQLILIDGDIVSFGDAAFLYFRTDTLYHKLLGTDEAFNVNELENRVVSLADPIF